MSTLTKETLDILRRPFTSAAVKWRADSKFPDTKKRVRCLVFIDSRLARERLNEVDPTWSAAYTFLAHTPNDPLGVGQFAPTLCELTVLGHTRKDVGTIATKNASSAASKSALSDALKRAAVQFEVGAYLYAMPSFHVDEGGYWMGKDRDGKEVVKGLTVRGVNQLRGTYELVIGQPEFKKRFGEPTDYGDVLDDERHVTPELVEGEQASLPVAKAVRV